MKPDGTHTIEEILEMCNTELQSWERDDLADRLNEFSIYNRIRDMDISELESITGYYIYDGEPEGRDELKDFTIEELITEITDRLQWMSIFECDRDELLHAVENAKVITLTKED